MSNEALAREQMLEHLKEQEKKKKADCEELQKIIEEIHTMRESGKSGWAKVKNPYKLIRKWRRDEDEKRMRRIGLHP